MGSPNITKRFAQPDSKQDLRPSPSDRCMDYHLMSWKTKITASERGAPPGKKKGLFKILGRALELCGTGKHPNINVKTHVPLELQVSD